MRAFMLMTCLALLAGCSLRSRQETSYPVVWGTWSVVLKDDTGTVLNSLDVTFFQNVDRVIHEPHARPLFGGPSRSYWHGFVERDNSIQFVVEGLPGHDSIGLSGQVDGDGMRGRWSGGKKGTWSAERLKEQNKTNRR